MRHDGISILHLFHCGILNHVVGAFGMSQNTIDLAQLPLMNPQIGRGEVPMQLHGRGQEHCVVEQQAKLFEDTGNVLGCLARQAILRSPAVCSSMEIGSSLTCAGTLDGLT